MKQESVRQLLLILLLINADKPGIQCFVSVEQKHTTEVRLGEPSSFAVLKSPMSQGHQTSCRHKRDTTTGTQRVNCARSLPPQ